METKFLLTLFSNGSYIVNMTDYIVSLEPLKAYFIILAYLGSLKDLSYISISGMLW